MSSLDTVSIDRVQRKQRIRAAEGYLDLIMVFDDRWSLTAIRAFHRSGIYSTNDTAVCILRKCGPPPFYRAIKYKSAYGSVAKF